MNESMFSDPTIWWFSLAIIFGMLEMLSGDFILLSIAIGLLGSGISSLLGFSLPIQLITFAIFSLSFYLGVRPFYKRYLKKISPNLKSGVDSLLHSEIMVTEVSEMNPYEGYGKIYGDNWQVEHFNKQSIVKNKVYQVVEVKSTRLIIKEKE